MIFILLLSSLFFYLFRVNQNIVNYAQNHDKVVALEILNTKINDFTFSINEFRNDDAINSSLKQFHTIFLGIKQSLQKQYPNNKRIKNELIALEKNFEEKEENVNYFKSLNASLMSGSHFLFDLQATISDSSSVTLKTKNSINEALFYLMRYTSSDYIDKSYVLEKLKNIQALAQETSNTHLKIFYKQSVVMLQTLSALKKSSLEIRNSQLSEKILALHASLDTFYNESFFKQKILASLFFSFAIIILLLLIVVHFKALKDSKRLLAFNYALQHSDNSIVITDTDKNITFVNDAFEKVTGYSAKEVLGQNPRILKSDIQDDSFYKEMNIKLAQGKKWEGEFVNKKKDGGLLYEKASIVPVLLNKKVINYLAIKLDVTQYIEQNMKLQQAASVFENTEEAIIIADAQGKVISLNNAFCTIYGYCLEDLKGKNLRILHSGEQSKNFYKNMWHQILETGTWQGKMINKIKDGNNIPVWSTIKAIYDKSGNVINYTAVQTNLQELEDSQEKVNYLAYHDLLTGLHNRSNFEEYLSQALLSAKRNNTLLAVLFLDLDRFKIINDTLGHDTGDKVLVHIARRLEETLRESDYISRWGGDEFVIILEDVAVTSDLALVANSIIESLKQPINIDEHHLSITASIGIALYPENGEDASTLIKHADSAMYLAKEKGKDKFEYYSASLSKKVQEKMTLSLALDNALKENEIYMVFQPQYDLKSKKIVALEALVRWENETLGFVPPDTFIPIAEENGKIVKLGYFIFEASCKEYRKMKDAGVPLKKIAINVSSIQFKEAPLLERFIALAERYDVPTTEIEIELTERLLFEQSVENSNLLQNFREAGFEISIDDFGTGYSSMSYLKHLPINTIKIDKAFVDDITEKGDVVVQAINSLAQTLGYSVVAEGIETQLQEEFLGSIDCDLGQGYFFSRPVSAQAIIERFATKS